MDKPTKKGGWKWTPEARKSFSELKKKITLGENNNFHGKHHSQETKDHLSQLRKGKQLSDDVRKAISEGHKGIKFTEEHKKRISAAMKGKPKSLEARQRMSVSKKGKPVIITPETARKISAALKGRVFTEEWRKKLSESAMTKDYVYGNTSIEIALQEGLKALGIPFSTNKKLFGRPDLFIDPNICIFADGKYFHADPRLYEEDDIIDGKPATFYWEQDKKVNERLRAEGFVVLRYWETEIKNNLKSCIGDILKHIGKSVNS